MSMVSISKSQLHVVERWLLTCLSSPEWGRLDKQIFGPGKKYHWESSWTFGLIDED
jgi:hypothetical protein